MPSPRLGPGPGRRSRSLTPAPQIQFPRYDQMMKWQIKQTLEKDPAVIKVLALLRSGELVAGKLFPMCVRHIPCESLPAAYNVLASELGRRKRDRIFVRAIPLTRNNETQIDSNKETKRSLKRHSRSRSRSRSRKYSSMERHRDRRQRSPTPVSVSRRKTSTWGRRQTLPSVSAKHDAKKSVILESCSNPVLPVGNKELELKKREWSKSKSHIPNENSKNSRPCRPLESNFDKVSSIETSIKIRKSRSQTRKSNVRRSRSRSLSLSSPDRHESKRQKICSESGALSQLSDKSLTKIPSKHGFDEESVQRLLGSGQTIKSEPDPEEEGIPLQLPFHNLISGTHTNHLPLSLSQGSNFSSSSMEQIIKLRTQDHVLTTICTTTAPKPSKTVKRHNLPATALSEDTEISDSYSIRGDTKLSNQAVLSTQDLVQDMLGRLFSFGERMNPHLQEQIKRYFPKSFSKRLLLSDKQFQNFLVKCQKRLENMAKLPLIPPITLERVEESLAKISRLLQLSQAHSRTGSSEDYDNDSGTWEHSGLSNLTSGFNDATGKSSPAPPFGIKVDTEVNQKEVTNQTPAPHPEVQTAGLGTAVPNNLISQEHGLFIGERQQINGNVGISSRRNPSYVDPFANFRRPRQSNSGTDCSKNKQSQR